MSNPAIDFHSGINQGVAPVTYGEGERPPRGDYGRARADYTCEQDWAAYTPAQHDLYRRLYERQAAQLPGLACQSSSRPSPTWVRPTASRALTSSASA